MNAQTNLGDFIAPDDLTHVTGAPANHIHTMASIKTPFDQRLRLASFRRSYSWL